MAQRDEYIPGVPCWVDTSQPDPVAAVGFYGDLFGWEFDDAMPADAANPYFIARLHGGTVAGVGAVQETAPPMAVWNTYVAVADADETADKVRDAGGKVIVEPLDVMDAGRMAVFADPEGAVFCVWEAKQHIGAQVVNEAGAVNFNDLHTRDVDGAQAFYRAVFGWQVLGMGGAFQAWVLPGYGDHLEQNDPGLRQRMADSGAPPGFEDVVASIIPIADHQPDMPAHWGITFAVDDADVTAAKTTELGGTVIAPPFDAPWVRMTVLADPQGARFIASKFVPENKDLAG
jgi:predicted enzyme related to lactoylglutathione lyase